jgi:hypothetical protein
MAKAGQAVSGGGGVVLTPVSERFGSKQQLQSRDREGAFVSYRLFKNARTLVFSSSDRMSL